MRERGGEKEERQRERARDSEGGSEGKSEISATTMASTDQPYQRQIAAAVFAKSAIDAQLAFNMIDLASKFKSLESQVLPFSER